MEQREEISQPARRGEGLKKKPDQIATRDRAGKQREELSALRSFSRKTAVALYCLSVFLLPVVFLPVTGFSLVLIKVIVLSLLLSGSGIAYFFSRRGERIPIPATFFYIFGGFATILLLSTIFSDSFKASFSGMGFEVGTFYTLFLGVMFAGLGSLIVTTHARFVAFFGSFLGGVGLLVSFHLLRFVVGPEKLALGAFTSATSTPAGSWFDLGVVVGAVYIVAFAVLSLGEVPDRLRAGFSAILLTAVAFLAVVNFKVILVVIAVLSLGMLAASLYKGRLGKQGVGIFAVIAVFVLMVFGTSIGNILNKKIGVGYSMIHPTWQDTGEIIKDNIFDLKNLVLGTGPNTFSYLWQDGRSEAVLLSDFWLADFSFGSAMLPTFLVTLGVLGALGLVVWVGYLLWLFTKSVRVTQTDSLSQTVFVASAGGAIFLFVTSFVTVFGLVPFVLACVFSGVAIGAATRLRLVRGISLDTGSAKGSIVFNVFAFVMCLIVLEIGMVTVARGVYGGAMKSVASLKDISKVSSIDARLALASGLERNDMYERTRTELALLEMQRLVTINEDEITEAHKDQFASAYERANASSEKAIYIDPRNYLNWISRGFVMETIALFQLKDTFEEASQAYAKARVENPTNPEIPLIQARLELARNHINKAREFAREAITMKPNHTSAYVLLANISIGVKDERGAIEAIEEGIKANPGNVALHYHLGVLNYNAKNYSKAITAFNEAIKIDHVYANARYFRGLSAFYSGNKDAALKDLEFVLERNKDNQTLEKVINNIRSGRDALFGIDESKGQLPPEPDESVIESNEGILGSGNIESVNQEAESEEGAE